MYRLAPSESIAEAARRLLNGELDGALEWLGGADRALDLRVHEARKHLKRVHAVLALGRSAIEPEALAEQARAAHAAARQLSGLRGRAALLVCFNDLLEHAPERLSADAVRSARAVLNLEDRATLDPEPLLAEARVILLRARASVNQLELGSELTGWQAWSPGFRSTYQEARRAYGHARNYPTPRQLHAFRTAEKRHLYHIELLEPVWEGPLRAQREELAELGEWLGDHHDLSLLWREFKRHPHIYEVRAALQTTVERRLHKLERSALDLAARAFAEKPAAITRRFGEYFRATFE